MKIVIGIILLFSVSYLDIKPACSTVKTGDFKLISRHTGTTLIHRTATKQVEHNQKLNVKVHYTLKWLDACQYQMFDAKIHKGEEIIEGRKTDTTTVTITDIQPTFYTATTTSTIMGLSSEVKVDILK
ncbi:MAG: hypothetical protein AAF587_26050 [Bacteroidota bacterium]